MSEHVQLICQWIHVLLLIASFFANVSYDFNGRAAKPPGGMSGFIGTLIATGLVTAVFYGSGALSLITN